MKFFIFVLALYHMVSARFVWLDTRMSNQQQQDIDDLFTDILNDMKLDISFETPPQSSFSDNQQNMFTFPSMLNTANNMLPYQRSSKPLFLMIESMNNNLAAQQQKQKQASVFTLQQNSKVNGNTWRYSVRTNGNNQRIVTETWYSTPRMYLCNSESCGKQSGMEMMNILDDFKDKKYMHLVPVTTMQSMGEKEDEYDIVYDYDEQNSENTWMGYAMNAVKGCHGKMKQMKDWYYGSDEEVEEEEDVSNEKVIILDDNSELLQERENVIGYKNDDILAIGMAAIIVLIIICGVLYAGWRYMIERKDRQVMDHYVAMQETDGF